MPPLFNFVPEYPIRKVQENEEQLQFNGLHQVAAVLNGLICCGRLFTQINEIKFSCRLGKNLV
jgi:hypothetical protein